MRSAPRRTSGHEYGWVMATFTARTVCDLSPNGGQVPGLAILLACP
jgi:hypothetical protein